MYLDITTHYKYCTNSDCLFGSGMLRNMTFSVFNFYTQEEKSEEKRTHNYIDLVRTTNIRNITVLSSSIW